AMLYKHAYADAFISVVCRKSIELPPVFVSPRVTFEHIPDGLTFQTFKTAEARSAEPLQFAKGSVQSKAPGGCTHDLEELTTNCLSDREYFLTAGRSWPTS